MAVSSLLRPFVKPCLPSVVKPEITYCLQLTENYHLEPGTTGGGSAGAGEGENKSEGKSTEGSVEMVHYNFDRVDLICLLLSFIFGLWYILKKHWIANNVFGLSFAIKGIEMLSLNSVTNGCILLGGLFLYDVFWVFGTDVMVTVAKSFDAPIKFIFPMDFLEKGVWGSNFALLGLGDVVLPGIFIALLLRFENSKSVGSRFYFISTCVAYLAGLILTVVVMHVFNAAQPALLYLVPACLGLPLSLAAVKGDLAELFRYEDYPSEDKGKEQAGTKYD
ncbi:minor histocompatibility antigen H13-like [Corticium candelabrum]|uniref:minor histocompatibility antigen H13-like n=1 Tax=Corticium candelabrum TaxID=121492 RepID=UPI002E268F2C|nr:minor histocompatibility antigen H13-like [Corticium candelabrum]